MAKYICLIFTDCILVSFNPKRQNISQSKGTVVQTMQVSQLSFNRGRELTKTRDNTVFIKKEGMQNTFHAGSNSSCCIYICQHYKTYQEWYKEENTPENHWAIPHPIWHIREESQKQHKGAKQATLDLVGMKLQGPQVFSHTDLLHAVTQFVTVDDQVGLTVESKLNMYNQSSSCLLLQTRQCFETVWWWCGQNQYYLTYQVLTMLSSTYITSLCVGCVGWK